MQKINRTVRLALAALALSAGPMGTAALLSAPALAQTSASAQSVSFPINLNTASDAQILSIPNVGQRMLREFLEYRPYANIEQFKRELGKYVDSAQITAWLQYVFVPTNPNTATEAQLTALKGVSASMAKDIIANRSYKDWNALKASLLKKHDTKTVAALERYWTFN